MNKNGQIPEIFSGTMIEAWKCTIRGQGESKFLLGEVSGKFYKGSND